MLCVPGKTLAAIVLLIFFSLVAAAQQKLTCKDLHKGTFYLYPKNSGTSFLNVREGNLLQEINLTNGDTALEKIKWIDDCTFSVSMIHMDGEQAKQVTETMRKHKLIFTIDDIGDNYYTFSGYLDKTTAPAFVKDTVWLHAKTNLTNSEFIR